MPQDSTSNLTYTVDEVGAALAAVQIDLEARELLTSLADAAQCFVVHEDSWTVTFSGDFRIFGDLLTHASPR